MFSCSFYWAESKASRIHTQLCPSLDSFTMSPNGRGCWGFIGKGEGGVFCTSEAGELAGPEHRGRAVGGPRPQMLFHLLCLHTELPSSQHWELALRVLSDPGGSAVVTALPLPQVLVWAFGASVLLISFSSFFFTKIFLYSINVSQNDSNIYKVMINLRQS